MSVLTDKDIAEIRSGSTKSKITIADAEIAEFFNPVFQTGWDRGYLAAIYAVLDSINGCYLPDRNPEYMDAWECGYTDGVDCVNNRIKAIKEKLSQ